MQTLDISTFNGLESKPWLTQIGISKYNFAHAGVVTSNCNIVLLDMSQCRVTGVIGDNIVQSSNHFEKTWVTSFDYLSEYEVYISYSNGLINVKDIRSGNASINSFGDLRPSRSNVSFNGEFLMAVGYEDSSIELWDLRNTSAVLGNLDGFHTDEISYLKFHPDSPHQLFSGACDWLVNRFDLSAGSVDDAFQSCFNVEQNPRRFGFFGSNNQFMHCSTEFETLCIMDLAQEDIVSTFDHESFEQNQDTEETKAIRDLINCVYSQSSGELFLFQGDSIGNAFAYQVNSEKVSPVAQKRVHQSTIRDIQSIPTTNV